MATAAINIIVRLNTYHYIYFIFYLLATNIWPLGNGGKLQLFFLTPKLAASSLSLESYPETKGIWKNERVVWGTQSKVEGLLTCAFGEQFTIWSAEFTPWTTGVKFFSSQQWGRPNGALHVVRRRMEEDGCERRSNQSLWCFAVTVVPTLMVRNSWLGIPWESHQYTALHSFGGGQTSIASEVVLVQGATGLPAMVVVKDPAHFPWPRSPGSC